MASVAEAREAQLPLARGDGPPAAHKEEGGMGDLLGRPWADNAEFYLDALVVSLVGLVVGLASVPYMLVVEKVSGWWLEKLGGEDFMETAASLDFMAGSPWWILVCWLGCTAVGIMKALIGLDAYPSFITELKHQSVDPWQSAKVCLTCMASLSAGGILGPEAGLGGAGGAVGYVACLLISRSRLVSQDPERLDMRRRTYILSGIAAAFGSILPAPFIAAQSLDVAQEAADEGSSRDSVRVYVRVRPPTEREQALAGQPAVVTAAATSSVLLRGDPTRSFTYDGVLGEDSTQEEAFDLAGRGVAASCLAGYNGSVYVYGQTGVGKTYTMSGPVTSVQSMQFDERRGLICRTLDSVFAEIHRRRARMDGITYLCRCSFLEIYKEQITDLLEPNNSNLQIREDMNRGVYVERLSEPAVSSLTEAFRVLWRGLQQRHIGATHMNERSSRSHAVFTLSVEAAQTRAGVTSTRVARLSLVDLAGSERQQGMPDAASGIAAPHQSERVKEAGAINKSLSALTNVVMSLSREERSRRRSSAAGDSRRSFVHYRDSKLTFLLRDSLGGNSKTVIVANVSPSNLCYAETLSTLKFAARAKHIRCAAVRNEEFSGTVESLMLEVKTLRQRLSDLGGRGFRAQLPLLAGGCGAAGAEALAGSDPETLEGSPTGSPREEGDEAQALYSRKRLRRLEVLLGAALARERHVDQRRHQLQRLAGFLEDIDFRKTQSLRKLLVEYTDHIARIETSAVSNDEEGVDLTAKLLSFGHLLGNVITGGAAEDAPAAAPPQEERPTPCGPEGILAASAAPGGTADHPSAPSLEVDAGTGAPAGLPSMPGGLVDEAGFLRAENRRLRLQLERHPEVRRLAAENRALRGQLQARNATAGRGRSSDAESSSDEAAPAAMGGGPNRRATFREAALPLTSEMLLNFAEADDDGTLRTWVDVQKMAKEVEELLRAKDGLAGLLKQLREEEGHGPEQRGLGPGPRADGGLSVVESRAVEEVMQAAQDALRVAHSISDVQRQVGGKVGNQLPSLSQSPRGPEGEAGRVRQALQKVNELPGTLDLVNSAYNEAYDEFQRLREAYESRLEECHFFELQCSRLDLHCHELAERLHGAGVPVRAGMGSFSVAGLSPAPAGQANSMKPKRSFSLSSLRDVGFWEQRFQELEQLTGIDEAETPQAQQHHVFQPPPRQAAQPMMLGSMEPVAGNARFRPVSPQDAAMVASGVAPGCLRQPLQPPVVVGAGGPKVLAYSTSLSGLHNRDPARPHGAPQVPWDQHVFRRVASAPQIPSGGELRACQVSAPAAAAPGAAKGTVPGEDLAGASCRYMRPATASGAGSGTGMAAAASAAATAPATGPALVARGSPARPQQQAATSSTASPPGSLSGTAMRQLAAASSNKDLRREPPRGHGAHSAGSMGHMPGRRLGGNGSSCGDVASDSGGVSAATSGPSSARTGPARSGSGAQGALGGRAGSGARGSSPRSGGNSQRPSMGSSAGRYPTARAAPSQRPHSLSVPRGSGVAATARGSSAYSSASVQQRYGA